MRHKSLQGEHCTWFALTISAGLRAYLTVVNIPSEDPLGKSNFSFASRCQLEKASLLGVGAHVYLLCPLSAGNLSLCAGPVCAATASLSSHVHQSPSVWKTVSSESSFVATLYFTGRLHTARQDAPHPTPQTAYLLPLLHTQPVNYLYPSAVFQAAHTDIF